jgi:glycosyltransferase 2 family protein
VRWRLVALWLGFIVTALFSYLALRAVRFEQAWSAFRASDFWWLPPALFALAGGVFLRAVRWRYLFARETRPSLRDVTAALMIGYFFNNVLPARAGEAARVIALHRRSGTSRAETAATVVVERVYDVLSLVILLFAASPWLPSVSWSRAAAILAGIFALGLAGALVAVLLWGDRPFRVLLRPLALLPFLGKDQLARAALNATHGLASIRRPRLVLGALFLTTLSWLVLALSCWLVVVAFHLDLSPLSGLLIVIAVNLAMILPSAPAGVGVFEAATLVSLRAYDVPTSPALSCAVVLHALNFLPYLAVGALILQAEAKATRAQAGSPRTRPS